MQADKGKSDVFEEAVGRDMKEKHNLRKQIRKGG
jgi:hypothetical protein